MLSDGMITPASRSALAQSILGEVAELLAAFAVDGTTGAIDLRSLPLTPSERDELETTLGRGDVVVGLDVAGASEIWETGYSAVWWVRHFGAGDNVAAERIEIAAIPEIVAAHRDDAAAAVVQLHRQLATISAAAAEQDSEHV